MEKYVGLDVSMEETSVCVLLVLNNAADEWKRPPREWFEAKTRFAVVFGERFVYQ